jgi:hypothetical protein
LEKLSDSYSEGKMANQLNRILFLIFVSVFVLNLSVPAQTHAGIVSGQVASQTTGKPLPDCNISVASLGKGTVSDSLGLYLLRLPIGNYTIEFSHLGFQAVVKEITLPAGRPRLRLDIKMAPIVIEGKPVTIFEDRQTASPTVQELERADIRNMPTLYFRRKPDLPQRLRDLPPLFAARGAGRKPGVNQPRNGTGIAFLRRRFSGPFRR